MAFCEKHIDAIKSCLDGKNVSSVLLEFGIRFHRVIFDHLQNFTYNPRGKAVPVSIIKNTDSQILLFVFIPFCKTSFSFFLECVSKHFFILQVLCLSSVM